MALKCQRVAVTPSLYDGTAANNNLLLSLTQFHSLTHLLTHTDHITSQLTMGRKKVMKWRKNHPADDSSGKREYRDDRKDIELHGGSYPLEEVKAMPEYKNMVEQTSSKKTYALNIGYCGTSYQGLQTNEGAITIEGLLERALFLSGGIKECNFGNLQKVGWTRAARTDKGVHAIGQCVSMRLTVDSEPDFIQQVNTCLPEDIRLFAMTKTTK
jgi:hypothetical protein